MPASIHRRKKGRAIPESLRASEQDRPDVARRRERWKARQATPIDPRRLVFIDETWAKTNMTRSHGRCARGARLVAKAPFGKWQTLAFPAALRCDRLTAPCVIDGPINGASFRAYVEQVLLPVPPRQATLSSWTTSRPDGTRSSQK